MVSTRLLPRLAPRSRVLDLGCGYGRIGSAIRQQRPDIDLFGADLALIYCALFRQRLAAPVVYADLSRPPFGTGTFDALVAVTSLMYQPAECRAQLPTMIARLLRPGGWALLVDPAREFMDLAARLKPSSRAASTGGTGFTLAEYRAIADGQPLQTLEMGAMPAFTAALPLLLFLDKFKALPSRALRTLAALDARSHGHRRYTLHRWLLLQKPTIE